MAVQSTAFERRVDMIAGIEAMRQFLESYNQKTAGYLRSHFSILKMKMPKQEFKFSFL